MNKSNTKQAFPKKQLPEPEFLSGGGSPLPSEPGYSPGLLETPITLNASPGGNSGLFFVDDPDLNRISQQEKERNQWHEFASLSERNPPRFDRVITELIIKDEVRGRQRSFRAGLALLVHQTALIALKEDLKHDVLGMNGRTEAELITAAWLLNVVQHAKPDTPGLALVDAYKMGKKMETCRHVAYTGYDMVLKKARYYYPDKCGIGLLCPHAARAEAQRLKARYIPALKMFLGNRRKRNRSWFFAVLTKPNCAANYEALLAHKRGLFETLLSIYKDLKKLGIVGSLSVLESPLSADRDFNGHLNIIFLTEGYVDWGAVRALWDGHCFFQSAEDCVAQTKEVYAKKGIHLAEVSQDDMLHRVLSELVKYAAKTVSVKSESVLGLQDAPPMVDWTAEEGVAFLAAGVRFRKTRGHAWLNDPTGSIWNEALRSKRKKWLVQADLPVSLACKTWRKGKNQLTKEEREPLKDVINGITRANLADTVWLDRGVYVHGRGYVFAIINLIQGNKSASESVPKRYKNKFLSSKSGVLAQPPPDYRERSPINDLFSVV